MNINNLVVEIDNITKNNNGGIAGSWSIKPKDEHFKSVDNASFKMKFVESEIKKQLLSAGIEVSNVEASGAEGDNPDIHQTVNSGSFLAS